jgi:hypothetical protein
VRTLVAIIALLAFGAAKLPLEHRLAEEHRAARFHGAQFSLDMRQQIGQFAFVAALSGFRALVADLLWIKAHIEWENTRWGSMALLFNNVTALQPRCVMFWDMAAWHMAWNASVFALNDPRIPREALRIRAQHEYFKLGEDFLKRGIENNPDRYDLYERLGMLYRDKFEDHCRAADAYDKAKDFPKVPTYLKRFAAYEMSWCPGREREAYERLRALYLIGDKERLPTLLKRLAFLQEKLHIPSAERVYNPPPNTDPVP